VVYRGRAHPELAGAYLYGDYSTGRIGGARREGAGSVWQRELADTPLAIVGFGVDADGEPLVVDYGGGFYRLVPNLAPTNAPPFPRRLSETGLFDDVTAPRPAAGVLAYDINVPGWHDGARGEHWLAAAAGTRLHPADNAPWQFDDGLALVQTLALGTGAVSRRVETRVLLKQENDWVGYTYVWNEGQTDAELAPAAGLRTTLELPEGRRPWLVPSRSDCLVCHSRAASFALSLATRQLNRARAGEPAVNQLRWLEQLDLLRTGTNSAALPTPPEAAPRYPNLADDAARLEDRARAYLAVNCSHCHVQEGGGNSLMDMAAWTPLKKARLIDQVPQHGTFNLRDARIITAGLPSRSVLVSRSALRLPGQMPPLGTLRPDPEGTRLLSQWISALGKPVP
jgi:mono/diheme cytochrome c family protein